MKTLTKLLYCVTLALVLILLPDTAAAQTLINTCEGEPVTLTVEDINDRKQWQISNDGGISFNNIPGATELSHTFTATTADNNKYYRVQFSNNGGQQTSISEIFQLSVNPLPSTPTAINGSRNGRGPVTLSASGAPADGSYRWYTVASAGTAIAGATGATYTTPSINSSTTYYVATVNSFGCESPRTAVTATVNPTTGPIVANDITNATLISSRDGQKAIDALSASYDDASISFYTIQTIPANAQGRLFVNSTPAVAGQTLTTSEATKLTFDPEPGFFGVASFTFTVTDNQGVRSDNTATYSIPVHPVPVASNVSSGNIPLGNTRVKISLLKATDQTGTIVSYTITSLPAAGTLWTAETGGIAIKAGQTITTNQLYFNPGGNGNGNPNREFTYLATSSNGIESNTATFYLFVNTDTPLPVAANVTSAPILNTAGIASIASLSATGGTIDGYRILASSLPTSSQGVLYSGATPITALAPVIDGYYEITPAQATDLRFEPSNSTYGFITFSYSAKNTTGTAYSSDATYTIPVKAAPIANNVTTSGVSNTEAAPEPINPLDATDPDGTIASFRITSLPASGTLYIGGAPVNNGNLATVYPATNGQLQGLTFKPASGFTGNLTFTFTATDNEGYSAASDATYTIQVFNLEALPVTLNSFTAQVKHQTVVMVWTTASEENNDRFEIERSLDGRDFEKIGTVKGNGTTSQTVRYTFTDAQTAPGTSYYRLKQLDTDGKYEYSKIIAVTIDDAPRVMARAYPNPFSRDLSIALTIKGTEEVKIRLSDMSGREVYSSKSVLAEGFKELNLPLNNLKQGAYILHITGNGLNKTLKVMKAE